MTLKLFKIDFWNWILYKIPGEKQFRKSPARGDFIHNIIPCDIICSNHFVVLETLVTNKKFTLVTSIFCKINLVTILFYGKAQSTLQTSWLFNVHFTEHNKKGGGRAFRNVWIGLFPSENTSENGMRGKKGHRNRNLGKVSE